MEEYTTHLFAKHGYRSMSREHFFGDFPALDGDSRINDGFITKFGPQKNNNQRKSKRPSRITEREDELQPVDRNNLPRPSLLITPTT